MYAPGQRHRLQHTPQQGPIVQQYSHPGDQQCGACCWVPLEHEPAHRRGYTTHASDQQRSSGDENPTGDLKHCDELTVQENSSTHKSPQAWSQRNSIESARWVACLIFCRYSDVSEVNNLHRANGKEYAVAGHTSSASLNLSSSSFSGAGCTSIMPSLLA